MVQQTKVAAFVSMCVCVVLIYGIRKEVSHLTTVNPIRHDPLNVQKAISIEFLPHKKDKATLQLFSGL